MNLNVDTSAAYAEAVEEWSMRPAVNECPEDNFRAGWEACARTVRHATKASRNGSRVVATVVAR